MVSNDLIDASRLAHVLALITPVSPATELSPLLLLAAHHPRLDQDGYVDEASVVYEVPVPRYGWKGFSAGFLAKKRPPSRPDSPIRPRALWDKQAAASRDFARLCRVISLRGEREGCSEEGDGDPAAGGGRSSHRTSWSPCWH